MQYSEMQPIGQLLKRERNIILKNADAASAKGFTMVPNFLLKSPKLSAGDKMTFAMLLSYAWQNDYCFPGQVRLGQDLGLHETNVRKHLKSLQANGRTQHSDLKDHTMSTEEEEEIKKRFRDHVTTIYCTLQAIIQGVALGILAEGIFHNNNDALANYSTWAIYAAACLSYVILIAFKFTVLYAGPYSKVRVRAIDIIVVFVLGVSEYVPIFYIFQPRRWVISLLFLSLVGDGAYIRTLLNLVEAEPNYKGVSALYNAAWWNTVIGLLLNVSLALAYAFIYFEIGLDIGSKWYPSLCVVLCGATLFVDEYFFLNKHFR